MTPSELQLPPLPWRQQFRFLNAEEPLPYWLVLRVLAERRRWNQLEVEFEELRGALAPVPEPNQLRQWLQQLETWGNVRQRLEPRRIRTLEDRSLERFKVRLTEPTVALLEFVSTEPVVEFLESSDLAQDRLRSMESAIGQLARVLFAEAPLAEERLEEAASHLRTAVRESEGAERDLLNFELALAASVLALPPGDETLRIVGNLQRYLEQYLRTLESLRSGAAEALARLLSAEGAASLAALQEFLDMRARQGSVGARAAMAMQVRERLEALLDFLSSGGELDRRCEGIHQASTDLLAKLRSRLEEVVRRSRRVAMVKDAIGLLLAAPDDGSQPAVDRYFEELWGSVVIRETGEGTPADREEVALPAAPGARAVRKQAPVLVQKAAPARGVRRSLQERDLEELNVWVEQALLRSRPRADVTEALVASDRDLALLYKAIRFGRDRQNPLVRRSLRFRVSLPQPPCTMVSLTTNRGVLTMPPFIVERSTGA